LNRDETTGSIDATVAHCLSGATLAPMTLMPYYHVKPLCRGGEVSPP